MYHFSTDHTGVQQKKWIHFYFLYQIFWNLNPTLPNSWVSPHFFKLKSFISWKKLLGEKEVKQREWKKETLNHIIAYSGCQGQIQDNVWSKIKMKSLVCFVEEKLDDDKLRETYKVEARALGVRIYWTCRLYIVFLVKMVLFSTQYNYSMDSDDLYMNK